MACGECCEEKTYLTPNLTGSDCVTVDKTDPDNWIVSTECNPIVTSDDLSVVVDVSTDPVG